jgi:hypothetical protein
VSVRRLLARRRTEAVGALALTATAVLGVLELRHLWRGSTARSSAHEGNYLQAGREATRETAAVAREGYRSGSVRENAVFNMLVAFLATFGSVRAVTYLIRAGKGPFGNLVIGDRHVHHFVPGIVIAFVAGGTSIGVRRQELDKWVAVPFGVGAALVLDEAALLLELEDVYWSAEGVVSVQITLATAALLAFLGLAVRVVRRGEPLVLAPLSTPEPAA